MKRIVTGILFLSLFLLAEANPWAQVFPTMSVSSEEQKEVATLIKGLKSSYNGYLKEIIEKLGQTGLKTQRAAVSRADLEEAVPELLRLMGNWEQTVWPSVESIADTLAKIGGAQAMAALKNGLEHRHYQIRRAAMKGLILISVENLKDKAILFNEFLKNNNHYLRKLIGDEDHQIRRDIAVVVGHFADGADQNSIEELIKIVKIKLMDKLPRVRQSAALTLGYMGRAAEPEIFALILASKDYRDDEWEKFCPVAQAAIWALGEVGVDRPDVIEALLAALNNKTETLFLRVAAVTALQKVGGVSDEVILALRDTALSDHESLVAGYAVDALYGMATADDRVMDQIIDIFIKILKEVDDSYIRFKVLMKLGGMGAKAQKAIPVLEKIVGASSASFSAYSAERETLEKIKKDLRKK